MYTHEPKKSHDGVHIPQMPSTGQYRAESVIGAQMQRETIGARARHKDAEADVRVNEGDRTAECVYGVFWVGG